MIDRRKFLYGAASLFAGPAIIRSGVLMPVKRLVLPPEPVLFPGVESYLLDRWEMYNGFGYVEIWRESDARVLADARL
jgi:hypothetical protein